MLAPRAASEAGEPAFVYREAPMPRPDAAHPPLARCLRAVLVLLAVSAPARADEASTADLIAEVNRTIARPERGVVQLWWLPTEFWVAASREIGQSPEEAEAVRRIFQDYLLIGAMDVRVDAAGQPSAASIAEIVERIEVWRGDEKLEVLRQVNPSLVDRSPQLTYAFKTSLQPLGTALRVLPLSNVDRGGQPVLAGDKAGDLRVIYKPADGGAPTEVRWRGPLTSVVGHATCPVDGEKLAASFRFCPHHGNALTPPTKSAP